MDPEFQRLLVLVTGGGGLIGGAGAVALYFVFRAFGGKQAGGPAHLALIFGLIALVLASCALLFALAYLR